MADRYYVPGGTNTWSATANWSASATLTPTGASVPTAADNVFFTSATTYSVTMTGAMACLDFTISAGTVTLAQGTTPTLSVAGNWSIIAGTVWSMTGAVTYTATTSKTINSNGVTINSPFTFNGTGGTWTLQNNLTLASTLTTTLTAGTLALSTFTLSTGLFSSASAVARTINFGTGKIVTTSATTSTVWNTSTITNLTITGTPLVECQGGGTTVTKTISAGALAEASAISFSLLETTGTATYAFTAANTVKNLITNGVQTISNIAITIYGAFTHTTTNGTTTFTAGANVWTFAATSSTYNITPAASFTYDFPWTFGSALSTATWTLADSVTLGSTRTLTLTTGTLALSTFTFTTGLFSSAGAVARTLNFGTGKIVLNSATTSTVWTTATVTGLTISGTPLVECQGGGTAVTKTINTGALSEANAISFSLLETTGTATYLFTASNVVKNLITNGVQTVSNIAISIYGSFTHSTANGTTTFTAGVNIWTFAATSGSYSITNINGFTYGFPWKFGSATSTATWTLADNLTITGTLTLTNGTLDVNNKTVTPSAGVTVLTGSATLNNTGGTTLNLGTITHTSGTLTLGTNVTSSGTYTLTAGTLSLVSYTLTIPAFSSANANARTLAFGTGKIVVSGTSTTPWNTGTVTNLTVTGTSLVEFQGGTGTVIKTINTGTLSEAQSMNFSLLETSGGTITYTFTAANAVKNLIINGAQTITNIAITIYGSLTHSTASGTTTFTAGANAWTFGATSGTYSLGHLAASTYDWPWTFGSAASTATWSLANNLTLGATRQLTLTNGTFDMNNKTISAAGFTIVTGTPTLANTGGSSPFTTTLPFTHTSGSFTLPFAITTTATTGYTLTAGTLALSTFTLTTTVFSSANANTRTLNFGTGKIVLSGNATATIWTTATVTGLTVSGTPLVECQGTSGTVVKTINTGALSEANAISFSLLETAGTTTYTFVAANTFKNLIVNSFQTTITNIAITIYGNFTHTTTNGTTTFTAGTNAWTFAATSGTYSLGHLAVTYDFPWIFGSAASTATWSLPNNLTLGATRQLSLANGTFDFNSKTLSSGGLTIVTGTPTIANTGTASLSLTVPITHTSGTLTLPFNLTTTSTTGYTLTAGTLSLSTFTLTTPVFSSANANARTLAFGTGKIVINSTTTSTVWTTATVTNLTVTGTSLVEFQGGGAAVTKTINTGVLTEAQAINFSLIETTGTATYTFTAANVVKNLIVNGVQTISNIAITIYGNFTHTTTNGTTTFTAGLNAWTFAATSGSYNITNIAGFTYDFPWTFGSAASTATWTLANNLTLGATRALTLVNGTVDFNSKTISAASITILTGAPIIANTGTASITFTIPIIHTSGTLSLYFNITTTAYTFTAGTLNLVSYTLTTRTFSSANNNTRIINFGTGNIAVGAASSGGTLVDFSTNTTGITTSGTPIININYAGATAVTINSPIPAPNSISYNFTAGTYTLTLGNISIFRDLNFTGFSGVLNTANSQTVIGNITFSNTMTNSPLTNTGGITFTGNITAVTNYTVTSNSMVIKCPITVNLTTATNTLTLVDDLTQDSTGAGGLFPLFTLTQGTFVLNNLTASLCFFSSTNSNIRGVNYGTSGVIVIPTLNGTFFDVTIATNFTSTGTPFVNLSTTAGSRTIVTGFSETQAAGYSVSTSGTSGFKLSTSVSDSIGLNGNFNSINLTGYVGTVGNYTRTIYGSLTIPASGGTYTAGALVTTFAATTSQIITTNARTLDFPFTFNGVGGTWTLQDALTSGSTRTTTLTNGTLNLNSFTHTTGFFSSSGAVARTLAFGNGQLALAGSNATIFDVTTATLFTTTGTPYVNCTYASSVGTRTIVTGFTEAQAVGYDVATSGTTGIVLSPSATDIVALTGSFEDINLTGFIGTLSNTTRKVYGNWINPLSSGTYNAGTAITTFGASSPKTITTNGRTLDFPLTFDGFGSGGVSIPVPIGQVLFASGSATGTGGSYTGTSSNSYTYTWTCPANVYNISVVCVGAGAGGTLEGGGGGGALAWANNISVIPGQTYTVLSGIGGGVSTSGGLSSFTIGSSSVLANGGVAGNGGAGGTYSVTSGISSTSGGGNGGAGAVIGAGDGSGGGGAGGYAGNGGAGGSGQYNGTTAPNGLPGSAGATNSGAGGGGGGSGTYGYGGGGGGGVGVFGYTGATGTGGAGGQGGSNYTGGYGGGGGSGGANGNNANTSGGNVGGYGGSYGGGAGGANTGGAGGAGAVRIIWPAIKLSDRSIYRSFGSTVGTTVLADDQSGTLSDSSGGGTWTLQDNLTIGSSRTATLTTGTLELNNLTFSTGAFSSTGTGFRTLAYGTSGQLALVGSGVTIFDITTAINFSSTGTVYVNSTYTSSIGTRTFVTGFTETQAVGYDIATSGTSGIILSPSATDIVVLSGSFFSVNLTGFTGTLSNVARTIYGSWTNPASGGTYTAGVNATTFASTTSQTITGNGRTLDFPITFNGVGGSWALQTAFTTGTTRTTTLTAGTLNLNNYTYTTQIFSSSGAVARTLAFGTSGQLAIVGSGLTIFDITTATNFSTTGTVYVNSTYASSVGTRTFVTGFNEVQADAGYSVATSGTTGIVLSPSATDIVALTGGYNDINLTGFTGTLSNVARTVYGNWTNPLSGGTYTAGAVATTFGSTSSQSITTNGRTLDFALTFDGVGGTWSLQDNLTIGATRILTWNNGTLDLNNFTLSNPASITINGGATGSFQLKNTGGTQSYTTTVAVTHTTGQLSLFYDMTFGAYTFTAGTITLNSYILTCATWTSTSTTARTFAFGTGNLTVSGSGACFTMTGATNVTVSGTPNVNITNTTTTATTVAAGAMTEASSFNFNFAPTAATAYTLTFLALAGHAARNVTFSSNFTGTWAATAACTIYGSVTLGSSMAPLTTSASAMTFGATSGIKTIQANSISIPFPITFNGVGGTFQLVNALTFSTTALTLTHTNGILDLNGFTLTTGIYATAAGTKNITFNNGTLLVSGSGATAFNNANPTNFTTTAGTGTGVISMYSGTAKTFVGGGSTYNCTLSNDGAGVLTVSGSNSIASIANGVSPATFTFTINTTQTITSSWNVVGTVGNLITINTTTAGTRATIAKSFTGYAYSDYLSVRDIAFTPDPNHNGTVPYYWALGDNSTNTSNNTGAAFVTQKVVFVIATAGTTSWTVPSDWNSTDNKIQLIGAGGGGGTSSATGPGRRGGGGGGGGGYTLVTNFSATQNSTVSLALGAGGATNVAGGATTFASGTYTAGGGGAGTAGTVSPGGGGAGGVGSTYNGGAGGNSYFASNGISGGGGGGAAGPRGNGGAGGDNIAGTNQQYVGSGGGGGNGGGSAGAAWPGTTLGGAGGNNADGVGGGASSVSGTVGGGGGGSYSSGTGGTPGSGSTGVDIFKIIGSGGGPGGTPATGGGAGAGVAGALYGAGGGGGSLRSTQQGSGTFAGGAGAQGLIVISYYPAAIVGSGGGSFFLFF